jgi:superfamily II DNA helicase RecQ
MQIKLFTIPIQGGEMITEEMNKFLRSKRVLQTESHLISSSSGAFWCFCIQYLEENTSPVGKGKTDYREVLDEASFARFARMRQIRKGLALEEGIPAYAIFTDEEMAGLARMEELTLSNMKTIKGVGEKKIEKYGAHFITKKGP